MRARSRSRIHPSLGSFDRDITPAIRCRWRNEERAIAAEDSEKARGASNIFKEIGQITDLLLVHELKDAATLLNSRQTELTPVEAPEGLLLRH
jgi:hypothetical protein